MKRIITPARPDWIQKAEEIGFTYHSCGQTPDNVDGTYWYEDAAYEFTTPEVDLIEKATEELHARCLDLVDYVIKDPRLLYQFGIRDDWHEYVCNSWKNKDPYIMGRFDLSFDPVSQEVKMLEYNGDTPTLVIETSLQQWFWLQEVKPQADQFNSLHEKLLEQFQNIKSRIPAGHTFYFSGLPTYPEEFQHTKYFMDLAAQSGIFCKYIAIADIGWNGSRFVDLEENPITFLHKLYPLEWMAQEQFGKHLASNTTGLIEPAWKMLLSNKSILPLLWDMFPNHPNLLPSYWNADSLGNDYIEKPILAREGANIRFHRSGLSDIVTGGSYGGNPVVYQANAKVPVFDGQHVIIGSWVVGDKAAGMIIRESENPIVTNTSRVVPHYFL